MAVARPVLPTNPIVSPWSSSKSLNFFDHAQRPVFFVHFFSQVLEKKKNSIRRPDITQKATKLTDQKKTQNKQTKK